MCFKDVQIVVQCKIPPGDLSAFEKALRVIFVVFLSWWRTLISIMFQGMGQRKENKFTVIHFAKMNGDHLPFTRLVLSQWGDDGLDCIGRVGKYSIELEEKGISLSLSSFVFVLWDEG